MGTWYGDVSDKLLVGSLVTAAPVAEVSQYLTWHLFNALVAHLHVTAAEALGDTLDVTLQHSVDKDHWVDLLAFTQVAGDEEMPYNETKSVVKQHDAQEAWGPYLRAVATPVGATASFTLGEVIVIGS